MPWKWWVCTFPPLPGEGGVGFLFIQIKLATAAIDYYQKFITVFYGTRSAVLLTSQYVKWICADVCFFFQWNAIKNCFRMTSAKYI